MICGWTSGIDTPGCCCGCLGSGTCSPQLSTDTVVNSCNGQVDSAGTPESCCMYNKTFGSCACYTVAEIQSSGFYNSCAQMISALGLQSVPGCPSAPPAATGSTGTNSASANAGRSSRATGNSGSSARAATSSSTGRSTATGTTSRTMTASSSRSSSTGTPGGEVITVAGNGTRGYLDASGLSAEFSWPGAIAFGSNGILYIADGWNNSIRQMDSHANVTTVIGTPSSSPFLWPIGVAVAPTGTLVVADNTGNQIWQVSGGSASVIAGNGNPSFQDGTGGPNGTAEFYNPSGVAVDAQGNIYVADTGNNRIRKIDAALNVTTIAGNGTAGFVNGVGTAAEFNGPWAVAVDAQGVVFVADTNNNCIRRIDTSGNVTTFAGNGTQGDMDGTGGPSGTAELSAPQGVTVTANGSLVVADTGNDRVKRVDGSGNVTTLAGNGNLGYMDGTAGPNGTAEFNGDGSVAVDAQGNIWVSDSTNNRIREVELQPTGTTGSTGSTGSRGTSGSSTGTTGACPPPSTVTCSLGSCPQGSVCGVVAGTCDCPDGTVAEDCTGAPCGSTNCTNGAWQCAPGSTTCGDPASFDVYCNLPDGGGGACPANSTCVNGTQCQCASGYQFETCSGQTCAPNCTYPGFYCAPG